MSKRYTILGLSVVLALALAVPALGGPTNPVASISASVKSVANKALKKAKAAQTTANTALSEAGSASSAAKNAQSTANEAKKKAESAQTAANKAQGTANEALASANSRLKTTEFRTGNTGAANTTAFKVAAAECPVGVVTGGGFGIGGSNDDEVTVSGEGSSIYGPGWLVTAEAISGKTPTWSLEAIAVCAKP